MCLHMFLFTGVMGDTAADKELVQASARCYSHTEMELLRWLGGRLRPKLTLGLGESVDRSVLRSFRLAFVSEVTVRSLRLGTT